MEEYFILFLNRKKYSFAKTSISCNTFACQWEPFSPTTRISLKANQKTLKEVLKTIEQKSEYTFFYKDADCDVNKKSRLT